MARHTRRPRKWQACDGKQAYTQEAAQAAAFRLLRNKGAIMQAYRCQFGCKLATGATAWHIGHRYRT